MPADLILANGRVLTFHGASPPAAPAGLSVETGRLLTCGGARRGAEAVAISGERIVAVGGADIVETWRGPATRLIDMGGACVIPGLNDAPAHSEREGRK